MFTSNDHDQQQQNSTLYWSNHSSKPLKLNDDLNEKIQHPHTTTTATTTNANNSGITESDWDEDSTTVMTYPRRNTAANSSNDAYDPLPDYTQAVETSTKPRSFSRTSEAANEVLDVNPAGESRFIKSVLFVNNDLNTRTLEIKMDKRIDLNEFKMHISGFLKLSNENFRVFRMCPNDFECELTSCENQFSYLTQNTKFVIKLGPPLKYGEYVVPIYKLSRDKGTMSYLCDFLIVHGMSVFNHKELLRDDLSDECNLVVTAEKYADLDSSLYPGV